jgi:hypothetical protein
MAHNNTNSEDLVKPIVSFACGKTYDLINETHIHAHPVSNYYPSKVYPFLMARANGGFTDILYRVVDHIELNPKDKSKVNALPAKYNSVKKYINRRLSTFGFNKAPTPYRFYLLEPIHRFKPAFVVESNNEHPRYYYFEDVGVPNPNKKPKSGNEKKQKVNNHNNDLDFLLTDDEETANIVDLVASKETVKIPDSEEEQYKQAAVLSVEQLEIVAKEHEAKDPEKREVTTNQYKRNPYIAELAKRQANGICQLCGEKAPFITADGKPYLETHHIRWLSEGGSDTIDNTVAVCPNCHRKLHILNDEKDVEYLMSLKKKEK